MKKETLEEFLARGGQIQKVTWRDVAARDSHLLDTWWQKPNGRAHTTRKMTDSDRHFQGAPWQR